MCTTVLTLPFLSPFSRFFDPNTQITYTHKSLDFEDDAFEAHTVCLLFIYLNRDSFIN